MKFLKHGKTKDVYQLDDGNILLKFKDTVTGGEDGSKDPGGNLVVGEVKGVGSSALKMTTYYFELLKKHNIPTHYVSSNVPEGEMIVRPAKALGCGLEFVVRYKACGSFVRRFGDYVKNGDVLVPPVFEVTLKNDACNDPPASFEILEGLKIMDKKTYEEIKGLSYDICGIVKDDLAARGLELIDIKIEFGMVDGKVALIDEISGGNMRVYKDGTQLDYIALSESVK